MTTRNVLVTSLILTIAATSFAATPKSDATGVSTSTKKASSAKAESEKVYFQKLEESAPVLTIDEPKVALEDMQKEIAASEARRPAQTAGFSDTGSDKLHEIRDRFLSLKTSDEFAALLADLDKNYDSYPTDVKFLAAQITTIQPLRGLIYRMRQMFQGRSNAVHSAVLTFAKNMATNFRIYLPQDSMNAVQEYFMSPFYSEGVMVTSFVTESDVQAVLTGPFRKKIQDAEARIGALDLSKPIVWDQQFSFGPNTFQDGLKRYRYIGDFEKSLVRSAMLATVASLSVLRAYNINNSIELSADLGHLYGIDGFLSVVDGVSAAKITHQIQKRPLIGTPLPDAAAHMKTALYASRASTYYALAAWRASAKPRQNEELYAVDTGYWRVRRPDLERNIEVAYRVINSTGTEKVRSSVTGEVIEINYSKFFDSPPNFQTLLPTDFDKKPTVTRQAVMSLTSNKTVPLTYRNYAQGSPTAWNVSAYAPYLPSVKGNDDVFQVMRVLSHAGGNWLTIAQ